MSDHAIRSVSGHAIRTVNDRAIRTVNGHAIRTVNGHANMSEKFEDTKGVTRSRKSKKERQYNSQMKRTNNDLQNIIQKTKYRATHTPLKPGGEIKCFRRIISSCFICSTRRVTLVSNPVISHE